MIDVPEYTGLQQAHNQWGVSGEDGKDHSWCIPYKTCFHAHAAFRNIPSYNWILMIKYSELNFKIYFQNDETWAQPNVLCTAFSFGVS